MVATAKREEEKQGGDDSKLLRLANKTSVRGETRETAVKVSGGVDVCVKG